MEQRRIRAVFMRGGTSNGLIFRAEDLPLAGAGRDAVILAAMGSPDPNMRQLDGMGGGISSLSKICIVGPSSHPGADVDYTFGQVGVDVPVVDYGGNCGNMSSAIGPFAVEEGMVPRPADGATVVRIHNTNTGKVIASRFQVRGGEPVVEGETGLDGVAGTAAEIRLEFLDPGGSKTGKLLPTGNPVDVIEVPGLGPVEVSLVDAANPMVFVAAESLGVPGHMMPAEIDKDAVLLKRLEDIRLRGAVMMGMAADIDAAAKVLSVPKIAMLAPSCDAPTLSGKGLRAAEADIAARTISVGQPHKAIPLTAALCLAAAARVPGTVAARLVASATPGAIRIAHPSGTMSVDAEMGMEDGVVTVHHATVLRTARRMMEGAVCVPARFFENLG